MTELDEDRLTLQRGFIAVLALVISAVFIWMIRDFLAALFLAAVLAIFVYPLQRSLTGLFRGQEALAASLVLIITVALVLLPLLALIGLVVSQAIDVGQSLTPWVQEQIRIIREEGLAGLPDWLPMRDAIGPYQDQIVSTVGSLGSNLSGFLVSGVTRATGSTFSAILNFFVLLFALFYLLTSGKQGLRSWLDLMPMRADDREHLAERVVSTIRATVKGTFIIAIIQGTLTGLALSVAGVPGAAFWGAVAGVLSVIPGVGPPLVWLPASIWLGMNGQLIPAIALAAWGAGVVGVIDNVLRPILVGKDAKMSDLMVLLSTLGGLTLFGAVGIIVGPVVAALFTSTWYIYQRSFEGLLTRQSIADLETAQPIIIAEDSDETGQGDEDSGPDEEA